MRPARSEFLVTGPYHPRVAAPVVVLVGTRGSGKKALVGAVLGNSPPVPDTAWVVHRHAATPASRAYLPGFPEPQRTAGPPGAPSAGLARPPRRLELDHRVELLRRLTLVDTPEVDTLDGAYAEITLDTAGPGGVLLFAIDDTRPLGDDEVSFLARAARRDCRVVFAVLGRYRLASAAEESGRAVVQARLPRLAAAPWCLVERAGAGTGARDLARELVAQVHAAVPATDIEPALTVNGVHRDWRAVLGRALAQCRLVALRFLAVDVAAVQDRCEDVIAGPHGPARLPDTLDRELHALSVRLTNGLESAGRGVVDHVLRAALGHPPDAAARARAATAIRRARAAAPPDDSPLDEVLLLASTAVVTTLRGTSALAALAAGPPTESSAVVRPLGIAVTAGCYALWRGRGDVDRTEASTWVERAIDSIAASLLDQTLSRLAELHRAMPAAVTAATDADATPPGSGPVPAGALA